MSETVRRKYLREREAAQLLEEVSRRLKIDVKSLLDAKKPSIEVAETSTAKIYYVNGRPVLARIKEALVPALLFEKALQSLPRIVVNMGAVPHICNGADVLAPGVVKVDGSFAPDDYVVVVDERHGKPLAVALALLDSDVLTSLSRGKVAKNLHYVGDALWGQLKKA